MKQPITKKVFIINGYNQVGKDSFVEFCGRYIHTKNISTVDKVKMAGRLLDWDGGKTEEDRAFLSELKLLADKYYQHSFKYVMQEFLNFMKDENQQAMFVHAREPENIDIIKRQIQCKTILVTNSNVKQVESNTADANVNNYRYDLEIINDGTLEDLHTTAKTFILDQF
jgi:hypothetical protein